MFSFVENKLAQKKIELAGVEAFCSEEKTRELSLENTSASRHAEFFSEKWIGSSVIAQSLCGSQKPYWSMRSLNASRPPSVTKMISSFTSLLSIAPTALVAPRV